MSFVLVVKDWSLTATNNFVQIQSMAMTLCAIGAGLIMARKKSYKASSFHDLVLPRHC
jgi:hypothetical protein